jgi:hypothetical protein
MKRLSEKKVKQVKDKKMKEIKEIKRHGARRSSEKKKIQHDILIRVLKRIIKHGLVPKVLDEVACEVSMSLDQSHLNIAYVLIAVVTHTFP